MLEDAKDNIYCGGKTDESEKFIEPTIITSKNSIFLTVEQSNNK